MTIRWIFYDPVLVETWTVPINPDGMTSPEKPAKNVRFAKYVHGELLEPRTMTFLVKPGARDWEFSGAIRTQAHYLELVRWTKKTNAVRVTDHLGRTWLCYLTDFVPVDRKPTLNTPWRLRYTVKAKILEQL